MPSILNPSKWLVKPPLGSRLNSGHPLAIGMVGCFPLQKEAEGAIRNLVTGVSYGNSGTAPVWENGPAGLALVTDGAGVCIKGTAEPLLRLQRVSLLWRGYFLDTPANSANIVGVTYSGTDINPYTTYSFYKNNSGQLTFGFNNGAFQNNGFRAMSDFVDGRLHQFVLTMNLQPTTANQSAYTDDGSLDGGGGTTGTILYDTSASFGIGDVVGGRDASMVTQCVYIWDRVLSRPEISALWREPFQIFTTPRRLVRYFAPTTASLQTITGSSGIASSETFGETDASVNHIVSGGSGIASAEAFGSGGAITGDQGITGGSGIASSEAFGSGDVALGDIVGAAGIVSAETFGSGGVVTGPIVGVAGIASAEAFGSTGAIITNEINGSVGIPSAEAFGSDGSVGMIVGTSGIASEEAFGSGGVLVYDQTLVGGAGIASTETFGSGGFVDGPQDITGSAGIASGEAFGASGTVAHLAGSAGIASEETFGSGGSVDIVTLSITGSTGIASAEAFGTGGAVGHGVEGYFGIPSAEAFGTDGAVLPISSGDPSVLIYWNGVRSNDYLKINTLSIRTPVRGRGEASFVWYSETGTVRPDLSDQIELYYRVDPSDVNSAVELIFAGTVEAVTERKLVKYQGATDIELNITCNDWNQILDRRLFTYVVPAGATCLTVLQAMRDQILTEEGIGLSAGDPGIVVPEKTYDHATCSEVLAEMCEASGWDARVGYDRILYFGPNPLPASDAAAPYSITDTSQEFTEISVSKSRNGSKYRNVMAMVLSGSDRANKALDTFTADGGTEYSLTTALTQAPIVTVNGIEQDVTVWGSFTPGWDVAWESGSNLLRFNPASPPTAGLSIEVEYPSDVANVLRVSNSVEIAARAAQEGGTGKYETKSSFGGEGGDISTIASEILGRYGEFASYSASVESNHWGWKAGQDVAVSITKPYMTAGTYYIEEVSHTFEYRNFSDSEWTSDFRTTLRLVKNGKKGQGYRDVLKPGGGGIGGGGGWGGGNGGFTPGGGGWSPGNTSWNFNETNATNTNNGGAPQRYVFSVAASQPGCTNGGIVEGHALPPQIVCFPGIIREIQAYLAVHDGDQAVIFDVRLNGVSLFATTAARPQFEPHGTTADYTPVIFNRFTSRSIPVRRGDLLQVVVLQAGSTDPDASGEEMGTDGQVVVVVV